MFYLLDDYKIYKAELFEKHKMLKIKTEWRDIYKSTSHIKKKSESVFDLIEIGDLVSVIDKKGNTEIIQIARIEYDKNIKFPILHTLKGYVPDLDKIKAIYKLDENKDYIKAWEV